MLKNDAVKLIQEAAKVYIAKAYNGSIVQNVECPICINDNNRWGIKMNCTHTFHFDCITRWIMQEQSCPMCRKSVVNHRIQKLNKLLQTYVDVLKLPVETLLGFETALHISFFNVDEVLLEPYMYEKNLNILENNAKYLNESVMSIFMLRWKLLQEIKNDVKNFDDLVHKTILNTVDYGHPKIDGIRRRLRSKFQDLYLRVKDNQIELSELKNDSTYMGRFLRTRLCSLWKIEKKIDRFVQISIPNRGMVLNRNHSIISMQPFSFDDISFNDSFI